MLTAEVIGNVGRDPEVREVKDGLKIVEFSVAHGVPKTDRTIWVKCIVWQKGLQDVVTNYVKKGVKVYVAGAQDIREWQDKEGKDRFSVEVRVETLELLSPKSQDNTAGDQNEGAEPAPTPTKTVTTAAKTTGTKKKTDDIPF